MLFNSYEFILAFLPATFFVYFWLNRHRFITAGKAWLVAASLFFYSWWGIGYLPLIVFSILVNYAIGTALGTQRNGLIGTLKTDLSRKAILVTGLVFNLSRSAKVS